MKAELYESRECEEMLQFEPQHVSAKFVHLLRALILGSYRFSKFSSSLKW